MCRAGTADRRLEPWGDPKGFAEDKDMDSLVYEPAKMWAQLQSAGTPPRYSNQSTWNDLKGSGKVNSMDSLVDDAAVNYDEQ
ncbi:unnamed protein product [Angiostrongylus costaricensis]|uniref:SCP domain-containing protein n=1 Tax=Angiostrongylus costaricensis TaxID=334426 RepID=A0A0R3PCP6_ANGCS|nr:unnamed protein product [Angiostrongylus costaricensis]